MEGLLEFATSVPDFRRTSRGNHRHRLDDIIILFILARMSKCVSRADIMEFGRHNLARFRAMGMLENGVPSEATLFRIERGIDECRMADAMQAFAGRFHEELTRFAPEQEIICIDGKAMCGTVLANGRNPDIVSAYSFRTGITLATEACQDKSNEIKAVPRLLDKMDIAGKVITADAMSMQKDIIDRIRRKEADFLIELKANQPSLRYGVEDRIKDINPLHSYTYGPDLAHGRIETRTYNIYDGLEIIADKEKWGGNMTIVEFESDVVYKSTGKRTAEKRLYVTSLHVDRPGIGPVVRNHWSIESMHWSLDRNMEQDHIRRKHTEAARNLDTIQRITQTTFSIWRGRRKKLTDKAKGNAELIRGIRMSFTNLMRFLSQK